MATVTGLTATRALAIDTAAANAQAAANAAQAAATAAQAAADAAQATADFAKAIFAVKSSDQSKNNTTTLADCVGLVCAAGSNRTYEMTAGLIYDGTVTADMKIGWTGPAGATMDWAPWGAGIGVGGGLSATPVDMDQRGLGTAAPCGTGGIGTKFFAAPRGRLVIGGTAGNLQLQFALNALEATNVTIFAGSWLKLVRIT